MSRILRRAINSGYWFALAILVIDSLLVFASLRTITRNDGEVDRSRVVLTELEHTLSLLKDAETGQRGYLLTGEKEYLVPHRAAELGLDVAFDRIRFLTMDHGGQQARVRDLEKIAAEKRAELRRTISLRQEGHADEALRRVLEGRGRSLMDQARQVAAAIRLEEERLLDRRVAATRSADRWTIITFTLTTGTAFLLLVGVYGIQRREVAAREQSADAIRQSEAWLSTTLTSIGDAVIATDGEGKIRFLNPIAQSLTGWSQDEATGKPMAEVFSIINETTRQVVENPAEKVLREGLTVGLANHTLLIARDGTEIPIDDSAAPIKDTQGRMVGVVLVFRDITGRKQQEKLAEEQRRLAEFGRDVGLALAESPDLATMTRRCAEETVRHLDGAFARIWTLDEIGEALELRASAGLYTHLDGPHARVPIGQYKIGRIAMERAPHLTNSVIGDPQVPAQEWAERERMVAFAGYPLIVEGRLLGVWAMFARHPLSADTLCAMQSMARGIAVGIDRKQAEDRLRREREWLRVTLASIGEAVIATDTAGQVTFLNRVAGSLTGWTEDEARGRPIEEVFRIVHERTRKPTEQPIAKVIREGVAVGLANQTLLIGRGGAEAPIEDSAAPILDPDRGMVGAVMVFRDVTEERAAQASIREAGDRLRFTLEATNVGQWDLDLATGMATRSPRHDQIFGYASASPDWDFDLFLSKHVHPESRLEVARAFQEVWDTGKDLDFECPIIRADGSSRWIWAKGSPYSADDGKPQRILGLVMDVTDRKQAEEDLRIAKEEAEQANRAKTQFLAILSHELRTPLNPILLAVTSMLERATSPEDLRPNLEMIRQNVNLQSRLIDDLLDVMRIVRGKMPLHWEVVNAHRLIEDAVRICRSEIYGKALQLKLELHADRHHINADPVRLQQVLWNLVKNAVKFTGNDGSISFKTRNESDPDGQGERLVIEVADTGIGIEPDVLGRIFDPFQQGETSITRKYGGLGLGLAICKGIVDGHGGLLVAESPGMDQGTTFRIGLRVLPEPEVESVHGRSSGSKAPESPAIRPLKILLVEDEEATRRLMARLLKSLGHEVAAAGTIADALIQEQSGDFGLIVSDIGLPDGTGLELMRQVVARRGPVPAIALTGYGMEEDIQRSREAGFTTHMTKPIDFSKLEAMIRQVAS